MECANCHRERERGQLYETYYGKKVGKDERYDLERLARIHTTHFFIAGQQGSWICDRCANRTYALFLGMFITFTPFMLAAMVGLVLSQPESDRPQMLLGSVACCLLPWILAGVFTFILKGRWRASLGERYAQKVTRKALRPQGFDAFFTPSEYKNLERH
jgi:hypothetical protein